MSEVSGSILRPIWRAFSEPRAAKPGGPIEFDPAPSPAFNRPRISFQYRVAGALVWDDQVGAPSNQIDHLSSRNTYAPWAFPVFPLLNCLPSSTQKSPVPNHRDAGVLQANKDAELRPAQPVAQDLQLHHLALCRNHREPAHQQRYQGHLSGLYWKAGNVRPCHVTMASPILGSDELRHGIPRIANSGFYSQLPRSTSDRLW